MTAIASARLTEHGPPTPSMGTLPSAANSLFYKNTIVSRDASGNAVVPTDGDGLPAMGVSRATFDNRTGSEAGGSAGDLDIEIDYGVHGFSISGATPLPGDTMYVVDNQTVSNDSAGGTRGVAGPCSEVRSVNGASQAFVWFGPHVASDALAASDALIVDIPVTSLRLSTGAAVPAFNDGVSDGFELTDSEALSLRINPGSTTTFVATVPIVNNDGNDLVLHMRGFRVGAADPTAAVTVGAFFHTTGAAHTADADAGGATTAFDGATTIVTDETVTIAAADVPVGPCTLTLTFTVTAALDADDLCILGIYLQGAQA